MVLLLTPLVAGLTAYFLPLYTAEKNSSITYTAMQEVAFDCPAVASFGVENWGNDGYARYCQEGGIKHGAWEAWQDGFRNIEGGFVNGEEDGEWSVFDSGGKLLRTVMYHQGKAVEEPHALSDDSI